MNPAAALNQARSTVPSGCEPATAMEHKKMNSPHGFLSYEVARVEIGEAISRAERARLVSSVNRQRGQLGLIGSVRRIFGSGIVAVGRRVEGAPGGPNDVIDLPSAGVLRIAR